MRRVLKVQYNNIYGNITSSPEVDNMSSLADQILERKNRLEALKQKASKTGGVVGSSTVNSFDCDVQPSLKKIKKDVQELRPEDKDIPCLLYTSRCV